MAGTSVEVVAASVWANCEGSRGAVGEVIWLNYLCGSVKVTGLHRRDILQTNTIQAHIYRTRKFPFHNSYLVNLRGITIYNNIWTTTAQGYVFKIMCKQRLSIILYYIRTCFDHFLPCSQCRSENQHRA